MNKRKNKESYLIPLVILLCFALFGLYMRFSIDYYQDLRNNFCKMNGFDNSYHEAIPQLFFCYNESTGEKRYFASYLGNYSLFDPEISCNTPQFRGSKICVFFINKENSCQIQKFKDGELCS